MEAFVFTFALGALSFLGMIFEAGLLLPADMLLFVWPGSMAGLLAVNPAAFCGFRRIGV